MPAPHPSPMMAKGRLDPHGCPTPRAPIPKRVPLPPHLGKRKPEMTQGVREDQGLFRALRSLDEK